MDIKKLMQQAKKMQKEMENKISEIEGKEYSSEMNGVKISILGSLEIQKIEISDSLFEDKEIAQDVLVVALNTVIKQIEKDKADVYGKAQQAAKGGGLF